MKFQVSCRFAAAAVVGLLILGADGARSQTGPFSALGGSWSGNGTIKKANGGIERIRCRSVYEPSATNLGLRIRCASDSFNIDINANVAYQGGNVSGHWQEATRNLSGDISGRSSGGGSDVQVVASASGVAFNITVATHGSHQSVSIVPPGVEITEVTVSMEKR